MKKIALEGPINKCSDSECKDWRASVISKIGSDFMFHNPMDFDCRGRETELEGDLVKFDTEGMKSSDIILVMAERPGWGTAMAVQMCHDWGKTIVSVFSGDSPSPWLKNRSTHMVKSLDEAVALIRGMR